MYKTYLVSSDFNEETGISTVTIKYYGKYYTAISKKHPDDRAKRYPGCYIAEQRAIIKAFKAKRKELIAECDACKNFVKALENYKNWDADKDNDNIKIVYRQLNKKITQVNNLTDVINEKIDDLQRYIRQVTAVNKAIERHLSKKDNQQ